VGNEKKEAAEKQNQPRRGKQDATNGSARNRKREMTDTSDSDEVFEERILFETVDEDSDDDAECPYCKELFSTDKCGGKWITCIKCHQWCHEECSGADDYKKLICAFCIDG
jgi:hypothetical protein